MDTNSSKSFPKKSHWRSKANVGQKALTTVARMLARKKIKAALRFSFWFVCSLFARLQQSRYPLNDLRQAKKIIIFLLPEYPMRSGGVLSIFNLCKMTRKSVQNAAVVLATFPSILTYAKLYWFENDEKIYSFSQIVNEHLSPDELWLHIPEYLAATFFSSLTDNEKKILRAQPHLHINILNQNILLMPERSRLEGLFSLTNQISQTAAHSSYACQQVCDRWGIPVHLFSAILPNPLAGSVLPSFEEKIGKLYVVFSPDWHPAKKSLQEAVKRSLPGCKVITIRNMSYSAYFTLISHAMFVITCGEGFDAYFTQPALVDTVSFSVFNEDFFPSQEWEELENVFPSYDDAVDSIGHVMAELSQDKERYISLVAKNKKKIESIYSLKTLESSIQRFYKRDFDFIPVRN